MNVYTVRDLIRGKVKIRYSDHL